MLITLFFCSYEINKVITCKTLEIFFVHLAQREMASRYCVPFDSNDLFSPKIDQKLNETISFFPIATMPFVIYNVLGSISVQRIYQICGPLIQMFEILAERQQSRSKTNLF